MRSLAEAAGVSAQCISLALRNHPSIGVATRNRIRRLAEKTGYRPDPQVARLMHHLRSRASQRISATVCALTTQTASVRDTYSELLLAGARRAATAAGFALEVFHVDLTDAASRRFQRLMRYRGVDGLMLLPMSDLRGLDDLLDWREFSVVSTTSSVPSPHFHCAMPSHFRNTLQLCTRLAGTGLHRPGLVMHAMQDLRCGHNFTAGLSWHGIYGGGEPTRAHLCEQLEAKALAKWLDRERPDVVVAERDAVAQVLRQGRLVPRSLPIVTCSGLPSGNGTFPFAGMFEEPGRIGAAAVDILTHMIVRGERGVPGHAQTTLIDGSWIDLPLG